MKLAKQIIQKSILPVALSMLLFSCGGDKASEENSEELSIAENAGREAARKLLAFEWSDSLELQNKLLEIKAEQSKFIMAGKEKSSEVYMQAFYSMLNSVDPEMAEMLNVE